MKQPMLGNQTFTPGDRLGGSTDIGFPSLYLCLYQITLNKDAGIPFPKVITCTQDNLVWGEDGLPRGGSIYSYLIELTKEVWDDYHRNSTLQIPRLMDT